MSNTVTAFVILMSLANDLPQKPANTQSYPLSQETLTKLNRQFDETISETTRQIEETPDNIEQYSRRGDAYFFKGEFAKAVADYEKMVELNPKLEASHWRRGIAYFYADEFKKAAHQFEIYHTFDNVDRENGIWRYLSQAKAYGIEKAREGLLKYEKDDREPFPSVYKLFAGETTPEDILKSINTAKISDEAREVRLFYAHLYIGLNHFVNNEKEPALTHLEKAVANTWAPEASFGPNYMWHVGRVHYDLLRNAKSK